eukprot:g1864.t1
MKAKSSRRSRRGKGRRRRITMTTIEPSTVTVNSAFTNAITLTKSKKTDNDAFEAALITPQKQRHKIFVPPKNNEKSSCSPSVTVNVNRRLSLSQVDTNRTEPNIKNDTSFVKKESLGCIVVDKPSSSSVQNSVKEQLEKPSTEEQASLKRLAALYDAILLSGQTPSMDVEIHLLVRLALVSSATTPTMANSNILTSAGAAIFFSVSVFDFAKPLVSSLGHDTVRKLNKYLSKDSDICRLTGLSGERVRHHISAVIAQQPPPVLLGRHSDEGKQAREWQRTTVGFSLPFRAATDSRNHFRTPAQMAVYQNRENTRDAFLQQLRQFQTWLHGSAGQLGIGAQAKAQHEATLQRCARDLLADVMPQNISWFAQLFLSELLQVCTASGETDQDVWHLLKIDGTSNKTGQEEKLRLLHERLRTKRPALEGTLDTIPETMPIEVEKKAKYQKSSSRNAKNSNQKSKKKGKCAQGTRPHVYGGSSVVQDSFPDVQLFFLLFILACDSHAFNTHFVTTATSQIRVLSLLEKKDESGTSSPSQEESKSIASKLVPVDLATLSRNLDNRVRSLRLLGKFLGLIHFSPNWPSNDPAVFGTVAFATARSDAIKQIDLCFGTIFSETSCDIDSFKSSHKFDVHRALVLGTYARRLVLTLPWATEYLKMVRDDHTFLRSRYIVHSLALLRKIRSMQFQDLSRPLPFSSAPTVALYIIMEIDDVFNHLEIKDRELSIRIERLVSKMNNLDSIEKTTESEHVSHHLDATEHLLSSAFLRRISPHLDNADRLLQHASSAEQRNSHIFNLKTSVNSPMRRKIRPQSHFVPKNVVGSAVKMKPPTKLLSGIWSKDLATPTKHHAVDGKLASPMFASTPKGTNFGNFGREKNEFSEFVLPGGGDAATLAAALLHQNMQLRVIVDFVVDATAKNASEDAAKHCILKTVQQYIVLETSDRFGDSASTPVLSQDLSLAKRVPDEISLAKFVKSVDMAAMKAAQVHGMHCCEIRAPTAVKSLVPRPTTTNEEALVDAACAVATLRSVQRCDLLLRELLPARVQCAVEENVRRAWRAKRRQDSTKERAAAAAAAAVTTISEPENIIPNGSLVFDANMLVALAGDEALDSDSGLLSSFAAKHVEELQEGKSKATEVESLCIDAIRCPGSRSSKNVWSLLVLNFILPLVQGYHKKCTQSSLYHSQHFTWLGGVLLTQNKEFQVDLDTKILKVFGIKTANLIE